MTTSDLKMPTLADKIKALAEIPVKVKKSPKPKKLGNTKGRKK